MDSQRGFLWSNVLGQELLEFFGEGDILIAIILQYFISIILTTNACSNN